jgi:glycosyltransferase involved in cell wall biosynthesis
MRYSIVNDNSKDNTEQVLKELCLKYPSVTYVTNPGPNGFGYAIRYRLESVHWRLRSHHDGDSFRFAI